MKIDGSAQRPLTDNRWEEARQRGRPFRRQEGLRNRRQDTSTSGFDTRSCNRSP